MVASFLRRIRRYRGWVFAPIPLSLAFLSVSFFFMPGAAGAQGLADLACGSDGRCQLCDAVKIVDRLIDFAIIDLAVPLAAVAFAWAGLLYVTSGGGSQISKAHGIFKNVGWGFLFVLGGWLIVDTIMQALVTNAVYLPWNKIECIAQPVPGPYSQSSYAYSQSSYSYSQSSYAPYSQSSYGPGYTPNPEEVAAAQRLLDQGHWRGAGGSCGGVGPRSTLSAVSGGTAPPVCSSGCTSSTACPPRNIHLNQTMLSNLETLHTSGLDFRINSITTGSHVSGSDHYRGRGVDVKALGGTTYYQLEARLRPGARLVQCERAGVALPSCSSGSPDHIHASY